MDINSKNKKLCLEPLRGIVTQGEKLADTVTFRLPNMYGNLTLSALSWQLRAASEKNTLATADLTSSASGEFCLVQWEVSADFTAVSGALSLMLVGTDSEGSVVIKFPGDDPIWVRDAETGQYSPPEDAIQKALNGLQQAESALEDATKALQEIGINFKILGHYGTLPELEAAVTNPSPGDAYGVGEPTIIYVWNGTSWAPLPGVFQPYPHDNLLVNPRFKYNSRGQSTYTGGVWTVDGWRLISGGSSPQITHSQNGIVYSDSTTSSANSTLNQYVANYESLVGKTVTLSLRYKTNASSMILTLWGTTESENITFVSESIPQSTEYNIFSITTTIDEENAYTGMRAIVGCNRVEATVSIDITAAKLELGSVSTLQAELDNPPPEDVEKLKLDMYSLDPGRCAYLPWHNENLLDNWYFVGGGSQQGGGQFPINQRGQTSYGAGVYCFDRWKLTNNTTAEINSSSVTFTNRSSSNNTFVEWRLPWDMSLTSKQITASLLLEDGTLLSCTGTTPSTVVSTTTRVCLSPTINNATLRIYAPSAGGTFTFQIMISPSASVDVVAAKLELGTRSTLARLVDGQWVLNDPPPNFQEELAKCQRYLFDPFMGFNGYADLTSGGFAFEQTKCVFCVFFPENMRVFPSLIGNDFSMFRIISTINGVLNFLIPVTNITIQNWASNRVTLHVTTSQSLDIGAACGLWVQQDSGSPPPILFSAEL